MQNINFIFLRSIVGNNEEFKNKERENFINKLNKNNDFIFDEKGQDVFFIETGGTEEKFKSIFSKYKEPYYLLATDANNSLPAALEISTFLKNNNKKFYLIHGTSDEVRELLKNENFAKISENSMGFSINTLLNGMRFGVIGKPSDWLIASDVNYAKAKENLGVTLIDISINEFLLEINNAKLDIDPIIFKPLLNKKVDQKTL